MKFCQRDHRAHVLSIPEFPRAGHFQLLEGVFEDRTVELFAVAPDFHRIGAVHMDKAAEAAQHAFQALGAAEDLFARFVGLFRPPGNRIQADGTARLLFLATDGGFEFGAQFPGSGIENTAATTRMTALGFVSRVSMSNIRWCIGVSGGRRGGLILLQNVRRCGPMRT